MDYSVPITLADGKARRLLYDFNALVALDEAGVNLLDAEALMSDPLKHLKEVRLILWAGLIHEDKAITPEDVGSLLVPLGKLGTWSERIAEAMKRSVLDDEGEPKNATTPEASSSAPAPNTSDTAAEPPTK